MAGWCDGNSGCATAKPAALVLSYGPYGDGHNDNNCKINEATNPAGPGKCSHMHDW